MRPIFKTPSSRDGLHNLHTRYRPGNYANLIAGKHRLDRT